MFDINSLEMQFRSLYQKAMTSGDPELNRMILQVQAALDSMKHNCCDSCVESAGYNVVELLHDIEKKLKER
ncbi:MAG: hypothetical protein IKU09_03575 [Firmicutes bacterium]|nr:hypothetical protein [Bacillota bacterium]